MKRMAISGSALWAILGLLPVVGVQAEEIRADGSVELRDAEGDMGPMRTSKGERPPLDVISLAIRSDGQRVELEVTLAQPPGNFASSVVELLIDSDDDAATGIGEFRGRPAGFDLQASVVLCVEYENGSSCSGSLGDAVTERWGALQLERFTGDHPYGPKETVIQAMEFPGERSSERRPVTGQVVSAAVDYVDLGVESGQVLRILTLETGGEPLDGDGAFPIVLLTLE